MNKIAWNSNEHFAIRRNTGRYLHTNGEWYSSSTAPSYEVPAMEMYKWKERLLGWFITSAEFVSENGRVISWQWQNR